MARLNPDGSLDGTFVPEVWGYFFGLSRIMVQGDGKVLLEGRLTWNGGPNFAGVLRLNQDGSRDTNYSGSTPEFGELGGGIGAVVLNGDGSMLLAAGNDFSSPPRPFLVKLYSNGSRDVTFGNGPAGPDNEIHTLAIQSDGRVLIGGDFRTVNLESRGGIARLNRDGSLDSSFLSALPGADGPVWDIVQQSDGKCVIAGEFRNVNGVPHQGIARLNADGSLDNDFNPVLVGSGRYVYALALQSDGRIITGGSFTSVNGLGRTNVARLNPDGSTDPSLVASAYGSLASVQALVLQPDGRIVIGGFFSTVNGASRNRIARLNNNGSLDTSFLNGLSGGDQAVWTIAVQNDGKTLVGGWFETFNGASRKYFVRLNVNGTVDTSFLAGLAGPNGGPWSLAVQDDGKILVGGSFGSFNGVARNNLARLNADGSLDASFLSGQPGADHGVWCLAPLPDGRLVIGGGFSVVNQIPRNSVARLMVNSVAPEIVTSPTSQTAETGASVRFAIQATGVPPPRYQWYCNGMVMPDCTNAVLELTNLPTAHNGSYTVVVTNILGAVTSGPVQLNVINTVERRSVPAINLMGEAGSFLTLEYANELSPAPVWLALDSVSLTSTSGLYFDLSAPLSTQRFYRAWQTGVPTVALTLSRPSMVPTITLTGSLGDEIRVDAINQFGPTDAWFTLDTVTLTNSSQLYFDVTAPRQPQRLYRFVPVP